MWRARPAPPRRRYSSRASAAAALGPCRMEGVPDIAARVLRAGRGGGERPSRHPNADARRRLDVAEAANQRPAPPSPFRPSLIGAPRVRSVTCAARTCGAAYGSSYAAAGDALSLRRRHSRQPGERAQVGGVAAARRWRAIPTSSQPPPSARAPAPRRTCRRRRAERPRQADVAALGLAHCAWLRFFDPLHASCALRGRVVSHHRLKTDATEHRRQRLDDRRSTSGRAIAVHDDQLDPPPSSHAHRSRCKQPGRSETASADATSARWCMTRRAQ